MPKKPSAWQRYVRFWGSNIPEDVNDELEFHIEMRVTDYVARGMSLDESRMLATERFGSRQRAQQECVVIDETFSRQQGRAAFTSDLRHDAIFALRLLRRQRLPSVVAVLCLALGIGATTTMFSIGNTLLLRPLPYPNASRVVAVNSIHTDEPRTSFVSSFPDYTDWRTLSHSFDDMGAQRTESFTFLLSTPIRVPGSLASARFLPLLGVQPEYGRFFTAEEDRPGAAKVIVVTHSLAETRLGGATSVVGKSFVVGGVQRTVIGVVADRWAFPASSQAYAPLARDYFNEGRANRGLEVYASLKAGMTVDAAQRDLNAVTTQLGQQFPEKDANIATRIIPLRERIVGSARSGLATLTVATVLVLLVACTNVAALQVSRATARAREIAIRTAIGASRLRLLRQLLTENVIIAVLGGALGTAVTLYGTRYVARTIAANSPPWMTFSVDWRALLFTLVISMFVGLAFGVLPALRLIRVAPSDVLRGGTGTTEGRGMTQRIFVVSEIALSVVLVIGAALAIQSVVRLQRTPLGLDPSNVLTFRVGLAGERYRSVHERGQLVEELAARVTAIPGVEAVGATTYVPITGCCSQFGTIIEGRPLDLKHVLMVTGNMITPGFFKSLHIPLLAGRDFTIADDSAAPKVAIISETFAKKFWPAGDAIGHRIDTGNGMGTIVGIVGDIKQARMIDPPEPQFYRPHLQDPWETMTYTVRVGGGDPQRIVPEIRRIMQTLDPTLPVFSINTLEKAIADVVDSHRLFGLLFAAFALVALLLATAGIYATMSFFVSRRTRELGLRVALGAEPRTVVSLVIAQGAVLAVAGATLGLVAGMFGARALAHTLYGVTASDPLIYVAAVVVLTAAALAATYGPARRASAIDPMVALRAD
ncbi:MAG TPA: ABC transporter permease [Gemmatimonadaceae bacterium]|jgi:predicted permease